MRDGTIAFGACAVRTPSCATRFELRAPARMKPGAKATVRVADTRGIGGIRPDLCIGPVGGRPRCNARAFPKAVSIASRRFRATERGREVRVRESDGVHLNVTGTAIAAKAVAKAIGELR